jgi:tRNA-2-methylthio-N6-dimethylallyladenosine synthase
MPTGPARSVYFETFGCQMNVLDSELVLGQLRAMGYAMTTDRDAADVVLFNTCSVRENAENKIHGRLGDLKHKRPDVIVGVLGCMAERDGGQLLKRYPQIDLMCGPAELDKVPALIDNAVKTRQPQLALQGHSSRRTATLDAAADSLEMLDLSRSISPTDHSGTAYVRITRGCNKFCTYCVVPYTRGPEVHRPPDHIVQECRKLADAGVIEVTLLGQTVNHYSFDHGASVVMGGVEQPQVGPGGAAFKRPEQYALGRRVTTFADLLKRIHDEVPAIQRLRFVTNYPRDFGDDILRVIADSPRICRYLHLPVQSGSNRILKLMNREYTHEEYRELVARTLDVLPDALIASDFIVGFPTETQEDHEATLDLVRHCRFKNSFIFKYSPRPGTTAIARFPDDVSADEKKRRTVELLKLQLDVSEEVHREQVGKTFDVLIEGVSEKGRRETGGGVELRWQSPTATVQLSGRTTGDLIVMFDAPGDAAGLVGQIVPVKINSAKPLALFGELVGNAIAIWA